MKKLIEIPDDVFNVMEAYKVATGRSVMSMIQEGIFRWAVHKKLIKFKTITITREKLVEKSKNVNKLPEANKFCSKDGCDEPIKLKEI